MAGNRTAWQLVAGSLMGVAGTLVSPAAPAADDEARDWSIAVGQRVWAASWDLTPLDARLVVAPDGTPGLRADVVTSTSSLQPVPITTLSARLSRFGLSASVSPRTRFSDSTYAGGSVSRSEFDLGLTVALTPNVDVALVYKEGKISRVATAAAEQLLGVSGGGRLRGWLVGVSGNAPLPPSTVFGSGLGVYGSLAVGSGRGRPHAAALEDFDVTYQIGEFGVRWLFNDGQPVGALRALSAQMGYRVQTLGQRFAATTVSLADPSVVLERRSRRVQSSTQGLIIGVVGVF